ncbi:MAG: hypothetical protein ACLQLO_00055 [Mycobacterium sp.]
MIRQSPRDVALAALAEGDVAGYLTWRCECGAVTYGRRWLRAAKAAVAASSDAGLVVLLEPRILLGE